MGRVCVLSLLLAAPVQAQPHPSPLEMRQDAELAAVTFLDADRGWAVGDRGVIWHTSDGGRTWQLQESGITCRLEAVQFLDANNGWAAGGWTEPYTHQTRGCLLRTRDGGRTWQSVPGLLLPGLTHLKMFNAKSGWVIGDSSSLFPAGVFRTNDGGRTWSPVAKGQTAGWVTGDFRDVQSGVVAGLAGELATIGGDQVRPARAADLRGRFVRRVQLADQSRGWLVGDGGLVQATSDGGHTWQAPAGALPRSAGDVDFRALATLGSHVWIAGAPGTCVLHSPDAGLTWQLQATDQTAPIRGLWFLDEYRGWAVGALGTVLHTRDGGQSWRVQRSGGKRVALLGVFSDPERLPLEAFALASGSEGYLSAVEILGRRDLEPSAGPHGLTLARRTHEAAVAAGASAAGTAWAFPLPEPGLPLTIDTVLARWKGLHDGQAAACLESHLVRRIRQWQPEVILTSDVSPRGDDPLGHLTSQITLSAVTKAADGAAYPEQIMDLGLAPWSVKKVLAVQSGDQQGAVTITPAQWSPRLARSLADAAEGGRSLLLADVVSPPRSIGLSLLVDHLPQATGRRDLMSGIALSPGSDARRQLTVPPPGDLEQLSRLAQKRHNVQQLLARIENGDPAAATWLSQIDNLTEGLSDRHCAEVLWQLGQRYYRAGNGQSAAEALEMLAERYPRQPLAEAAALWLVRHYASSEIAWRHRQASKYTVQLVSAASQREDAARRRPETTDKAGAPLEVVDRSQRAALTGLGHSQAAAPQMTAAERAGRALAVAKQVERTWPVLFARADLKFPLAAASRQAGNGTQKDPRPIDLPAPGPWAASAAAEHWLLSPQGPPPKKVLSVVTALERPTLDGRLDEPLWQAAKSVTLAGIAAGGNDLGAAAVLACDDEFLYLAISCQKAPGCEYAADNAPRPHDSDLAERDHVTLLLDMDRDYATFWQLSVDYRGFPSTACAGDATWNPQWFIAAGGDEKWWTVEAAIPLAELGPRRPQVRDVWAAQVQRVVPRVGLQSFSQPAAVRIRPEGFGLLVFE